MIGRTFVDLQQNIEIEDIVKKLRELEGRKFRTSKGNNYTLSKIINGETKDYFSENSKSRDFVPILLSLSVEMRGTRPKLNSSRTDIQIEKYTRNVNKDPFFWIFKDKIIFSKVSETRDYVITILNQIFRPPIEIPFYDINKLHKDYKDTGKIKGYGFNGRKDSANAGSLYFHNGIDETDVMVQETDNVGKSFVSLTQVIDDSDFSVYSTGAIVISKDWFNMTTYINKLMEIRDFLRPYEKN